MSTTKRQERFLTISKKWILNVDLGKIFETITEYTRAAEIIAIKENATEMSLIGATTACLAEKNSDYTLIVMG